MVATGISLWPAAAGDVAGAVAGRDHPRHDGEFTLARHGLRADRDRRRRAPRPTASTPGATLATLWPDRWTTVQRASGRRPGGAAVHHGRAGPGLAGACPRPAPAAGSAPSCRIPTPRDLLARRDESFARVQEHYYADPPQIERGWRHFLMSTAGRVYLDMVNNVTVLGHAHPAVADAANRQLRRLNTNSRFNYEAVVEFSERLAATLPEPLDTVFLVNSGSEASDLALRLAMAATGRRDVVAVREAYHGWTYATDAVSTSTADNPERTDHPTRLGAYGGVAQQLSRQVPRRGRRAGTPIDAVRQVEELVAAGRPPAGVHLRDRVRQRRRHGAARRLSAAGLRRRASGAADSPSPTRSRSATADSASGSGVFTSRAWCPTSCPSRSRRATAIRWARSSPVAPSPTRSARRGTSSRRPAAARCRARSGSPCSTCSPTKTCRATRHASART